MEIHHPTLSGSQLANIFAKDHEFSQKAIHVPVPASVLEDLEDFRRNDDPPETPDYLDCMLPLVFGSLALGSTLLLIRASDKKGSKKSRVVGDDSRVFEGNSSSRGDKGSQTSEQGQEQIDTGEWNDFNRIVVLQQGIKELSRMINNDDFHQVMTLTHAKTQGYDHLRNAQASVMQKGHQDKTFEPKDKRKAKDMLKRAQAELKQIQSDPKRYNTSTEHSIPDQQESVGRTPGSMFGCIRDMNGNLVDD